MEERFIRRIFDLHSYTKNVMVRAVNLQIGHSVAKERDFGIELEITGNPRVEVAFSHRHQFYAVYWIHEGSGTHVIDFENYDICPDRVFFVRPEQVHFLRADAGMKYSALQFTEEFMLSCKPSAGYERMSRGIAVYKDLNEAERQRLHVLFRLLRDESVSGLPGSAVILQSEVNTLLLELERMSRPVDLPSALPDLLGRYREQVEEHFLHLRQVKEYAGLLGVSPNYLNVLAQKYWGKSALSVINGRIVLEVKRLLMSTDDDISEISYRTGFNELSYFSRFFKRHTGVTPHEFRKTMNEMYQK